MNACVIGYGMVGKAFADVFGIDKIYTRDPKESTITLEEAAKCRLIFICLPTPVLPNGTYLTTDIINIIEKIEAAVSYDQFPLYIIRSTVYPGFAQYLSDRLNITRIVSNPEFLSEDTAIADTKNPSFILLGGQKLEYMEEVAAFYASVVRNSNVIKTDTKSAEMAKLAMNAYFALKVIFANDLYDACIEKDINYETVKEVLENHPYGPKNHFTIFYKGKRGVRGNCLPKDSKAYAHYANSAMMARVVKMNEQLVKEDDETQA